ncbi:uncharacterized protein LOC125941248 [Dermacentor silvarum]|uniref:uncharacterized protein LOC125941248 n=1 Tax=Dermacentor silvarum TaxID=543639 RepID=UPI0021012F4E|nr:uncharacterized protein LOC125941248 [Dermacentor silvarum]XP_049514160.1 uncharacterized protein LOC125941248 [Dermacentor silvarum]XP_049514161.1 uncharacterized protein LOC125941248 [Dermacentor silvarum]XP_049514162.1 uncharacterized protein LOC125941248 [Dermacentor silvarum]XP_049514163.1 uncharacterized protein LOC125941248 [Dermacentor silvarum]
MTEYNPSDPWPTATLAHFLEIRNKRGFHQIYPNGLLRGYDYEIDTPSIIYNGWTVRVFMFRSQKKPLVAIHMIYNNSYYCKTEIHDGQNVVRTLQAGYDPTNNREMGVSVKPGDVYSIGIQLRSSKFLISVANEITGDWMNMKSITANEFKLKIWSRSDVVLSLHMSEEVLDQYSRLPWFFDLPDSSQPPGSCIIALLECTNPNEDTLVRLDNEGTGRHNLANVNYGKVPGLMKGQTFYVYIRNLPDRYTVATSFDPVPRTVAHKSAKNNIFYYRSDNCEYLRMTQYNLVGTGS